MNEDELKEKITELRMQLYQAKSKATSVQILVIDFARLIKSLLGYVPHCYGYQWYHTDQGPAQKPCSCLRCKANELLKQAECYMHQIDK